MAGRIQGPKLETEYELPGLGLAVAFSGIPIVNSIHVLDGNVFMCRDEPAYSKLELSTPHTLPHQAFF